eukprot:g8669.t1
MLWGPIPSQVYTNLVGCLPEASSNFQVPKLPGDQQQLPYFLSLRACDGGVEANVIKAEQDAEYEIAQAEDVANAIRRGKQGNLPKEENDEEKQLRWALAESIRQGTAAVAKNDKDKAMQQMLRDAEQQEAVPAWSGQKVVEVGTRTGASAQGESRAERAARMAESFARIVGKNRPKRTESLANLPKRTESLASLPKRTESLANLPSVRAARVRIRVKYRF